MPIRVNFADVETFNFEAIPAGTYHAKVTDGQMTEVRNQGGKLAVGTPGVNWEFTIQEGEHAGRKVWTNTWIADSTMPMLKGLLEATGRFSREQLDGDLEFDIPDVIGADVNVVVTQREYNGEARNDVRRVKAYDASRAAQATSLLPS